MQDLKDFQIAKEAGKVNWFCTLLLNLVRHGQNVDLVLELRRRAVDVKLVNVD